MTSVIEALVETIHLGWIRADDALQAREATVPERLLDADELHAELLRERIRAADRLQRARTLALRIACGAGTDDAQRAHELLHDLASRSAAPSSSRARACLAAGVGGHGSERSHGFAALTEP